MRDLSIKWLRGLAEKGGKGIVNHTDARSLGRVADELEEAAERIAALASEPVAGTEETARLFEMLATGIEQHQCGDEWDVIGFTEEEHDRLPSLLRSALTPQVLRAGEPTPHPVQMSNAEIADGLDEYRREWPSLELPTADLLNCAAQRLRATPPAPGAADRAEWKPIETAPRDGTDITVWHKVWKCPVSARYLAYRKSDCKWVETTLTTQWPDDCFTHWQPLPTAPLAPANTGETDR